jgi:hypothetical protein
LHEENPAISSRIKVKQESDLCVGMKCFEIRGGLRIDQKKEWFLALNVARGNKHTEETNISAFPYQREKPTTNETQIDSKWMCKESTLQKEEVGGRGHHV